MADLVTRKKAKTPVVARPEDAVFSIRCYINGRRKNTDELDRKEATNFLIAAEHLVEYLKKEYSI